MARARRVAHHPGLYRDARWHCAVEHSARAGRLHATARGEAERLQGQSARVDPRQWQQLHGRRHGRGARGGGREALIDITVERVSKFFILWSQTSLRFARLPSPFLIRLLAGALIDDPRHLRRAAEPRPADTASSAASSSRRSSRRGSPTRWASAAGGPPRHHGSPQFSYSSAPDLMLAVLSQHTERIRLGHSGCLGPFDINHPMRIAERAAFLDNVSGGGSSSGSPALCPTSGRRSASIPT
ncbi:MAG: LLM class flavin-dependent oxidoreductase [Deltaproteobacteria bacterium]|nr:LLM class flavin-dependent oxidoreductase [Deltaproteobacteria bacterium]